MGRILKNEIYIGNVINGREEMIEIYSNERKALPNDKWHITYRPELAIIEKEIYEEALTIRNSRFHAFVEKKERSSNKHLFSSLIKCSECKASYRRLQVRNKSRQASWGCNSRNYYGVDACSNAVTVKEEEVITAIREYLCKLYMEFPVLTKRTVEELKKLTDTEDKQMDTKVKIQHELEELRFKQERQILMCEKGLLSFEEFEKRSAEVRRGIKQLEETLHNAEDSSCLDWEEKYHTIKKQLLTNPSIIISSIQFTNTMLKKMVTSVEVNPLGNVVIYFNQYKGLV